MFETVERVYNHTSHPQRNPYVQEAMQNSSWHQGGSPAERRHVDRHVKHSQP